MHSRICILSLLLVVMFDGVAARADGLLRRGPRPNPTEHVPLLIKTLNSDLDDRRRADAASDLRDYDPKTFPDIIPALVEALNNDSSTSVRVEAATSIGKLRPISLIGGYALEQAEMNDPALRVRVVATTHLKVWVLFHGYKRGRMPDPLANQSEEPPLADPLPPPLPKSYPAKGPPYESPKPPIETLRTPPPLMPSQTTSSPRNDRFFPQLMKRIKPGSRNQPDEGGPILPNPR